MSKNSKIQTMSNDLDEIKNKSEKLSQRKNEKLTIKPVDSSGVAKQVEPKKSIVESVIRHMADETVGAEKKSESVKNDELKNLVNRISDSVSENKLVIKAAKKEEVFDAKKLFEPNVELADQKGDKKIGEEIDKEIEKRINKETEDTVSANMAKNVTDEKKSVVDQKEELQNSGAEELKSLIDRISNDSLSAPAKKNKTANKVLGNIKNDIGKTLALVKVQEKTSLDVLNKNVKNDAEKDQKRISDSDKIKNAEKEKKSFWSSISEKLKRDSSHNKISENEIRQSKRNLESKIEKYHTGILAENGKKKVEEIKKKEKEGKEKTGYLNADKYVLPENRLIHGRQKYYSSVSKKIKMRKEKDEIKELKDAAAVKKKQKILSRDEEYKKLKKSIIEKYHIKLFSLPWKKIIPVGLIIVLTVGLSFYCLMSLVPSEPLPSLPPAAVYGNELSEFANLEKKITIFESDFKGFNSLEEDAKNIFNVDRKLEVIKLVIFDTENKENKNILLLENYFDAVGIIDVENNVNNLPRNFLEMLTNDYSLFIFKTKKNTIRYGMAINLKDRDSMFEIMEKWEKERRINKKMVTVFKPLFVSDKNFEDAEKSFSSANYRGVKIKYVHLIDEDTALNYFVYSDKESGNDLLVITTSKDNVFTIADLLVDRQY